MNSGEYVNFSCKRTNLIHSSSVDSLFVNEKPSTNYLLLNLVNEFGKYYFDVRIFFRIVSNDSVLNGLHSCITNVLVICIESEFNVFFNCCIDLVEHVVIEFS